MRLSAEARHNPEAQTQIRRWIWRCRIAGQGHGALPPGPRLQSFNPSSRPQYLLLRCQGPFMFHDHHIFPMPAQEKNELSSHPGQLQRTHCVQCVEGGVIPRGRNAAIFRGASVTHPCKGRHAPGKTGRENGSTDISTLSFQSTSSAQTKFHYYMHESSALLLLLFKKKIWSSSAVHPDIFSRKYLKLNPLKLHFIPFILYINYF